MPPQQQILAMLEEGLRLHNAGRLAEAEALYRRVLAQDPRQPGALHVLGILAFETGHLEEAAQLMHEAVTIQPNYPVALANLGNVLETLGRFDAAIDACRRAVALDPGLAAAHNTLGMTLLNSGRSVGAAESFEHAIAADPNHLHALTNLASVQAALANLDQAMALCRRALAADRMHVAAHDSLIFFMHFHPGCDAAAVREEQRRWWQTFGDPLPPAGTFPNDRDPDRRLRIGYVSGDFSNHVVAFNLLPLLRNHDHANCEIFCYSNVARPSALTQRLRANADGWHDITRLDDDQAARLVRDDRIDVLVDLSLHSAHNRLRLFARQPAPVQASFAGYPASAGLETIRYRLTDRQLDPPGVDGDRFWADEPAYLPHSFWCYAPTGAEPPVNELPMRAAGRVTFGCLSTLRKVNDDVLRLWAWVLRAVPDSRLVLLAPPGEHRQRLTDVIARAGVDAAADRVEWVEPADRMTYMSRYHDIDVMLDTFPYNGHTTSLDALWMGVPVVALRGRTSVGRAGVSQLTNLGLTELIANDADDFVRIATQLASDPQRLAQLRATLRERMRASSLCDQRGFAKGVEDALRAIWRRWCEAR